MSLLSQTTLFGPAEPEPIDAEAQRLLQRTVDTFARASREFALGRVESGKWASEYVYFRRFTLMHRRAAVVRELRTRLAEHAVSEADADANQLMRAYHTVRLLSGKADCLAFDPGRPDGTDWRPLPWGHLVALSGLIARDDTTEEYDVFPGVAVEAARELFAWACGSDQGRPSRKEIADAVLRLVNPRKAGAKAGAADAGTDSAGAMDDAGPADAMSGPAQPDVRKAAREAGVQTAASMMVDLVRAAGDGAAVLRHFAALAEWSPDMAVAIANGIHEAAPRSARALYLALRNLMNQAADVADSNPEVADSNPEAADATA